MKSLFLFFTQGEAGAPQYLSRTGEQGAEALSETIFTFLKDSLHLDLLSTLEARAKSLNEDILWKSFKEPASLPQAIQASIRLFPQLLLLAGNEMRSLKTTEILANRIALPVCVDERLDRHASSKPEIGTLKDALNDLSKLLSNEINPSIILVGTSFNSLSEWIRTHIPANKCVEFEKILSISSENDVIPSVLIAGFEKEDGQEKWFFDLPDKS
ncbi:hypothetical protein [Fluviispira sanaruensis]|uniref:Uncharacterized protein n=1 Tax=Fluviispira sanaruensis TaxID=2493639 RepID=A0A4P2VQ11_FLUSA|nr:hypothetical protein [Fluviispira sanaruensis]BBH54009.1 hypothetical protein JCM31447_24660 [Fluviispira sanaruensis]